jgi:hypothetical protein
MKHNFWLIILPLAIIVLAIAGLLDAIAKDWTAMGIDIIAILVSMFAYQLLKDTN